MRFVTTILLTIGLGSMACFVRADQPRYRLVVIDPASDPNSPLKTPVPHCINDTGSFCGFVLVRDGGGATSVRAFLFEQNHWMLIPFPDDLGPRSIALRMNNRGEVVGCVHNQQREPQPYVFRNGKLHLLDTAGYSGGQATDINEAGSIVGFLRESLHQPQVAVVWHQGVPSVLDDLPEEGPSYANAINDRGEIAGMSGKTAWLLRDGDLTALIDADTPGNFNVNGLSDRGVVAGFMTGMPSRERCAVTWRDGQIRVLKSLSKENSNEIAHSINKHGWAVGYRYTKRRARAKLWRDNEAYDLNGLVDSLPEGVVLSSARYINNRGVICGIGRKNGTVIGFVLMPDINET